MKRLALAVLLAGCLSKPGEPNGLTDGGPGDGSMNDAGTNVGRFTTIAAGDNHVCGLGQDQRIYCWGDNSYAQLGYDTDATMVALSPNPVGTSTGWTALATGANHTCGIIGTEVRCWGANNIDQTNDGSPTTAVTLPTGFVPRKLFAHDDASCALDVDGALACWGGYAVQPPTDPKTLEPGGAGLVYTQIAINSDHACALTSTGSVACWGSNSHLQLGIPMMYTTETPATAMLHANPNGPYLAIAVSNQSTCGIYQPTGTTNLVLECWGANSVVFADKNPGGTDTSSLIIDTTYPWQSLAMRTDFACGLANGAVRCWGQGDTGQLGDGFITSHAIVATEIVANASQIVTGDEFACSLDATTGNAWCWGKNDYGNLGIGVRAKETRPKTISPTGWTFNRITVGDHHACALRSDTAGAGMLYCWGDNRDKQVDSDDIALFEISPHAVSNVGQSSLLTTGTAHSCAKLVGNGHTVCWGDNSFSQLGTSNTSKFHDLGALGTTWMSAGVYQTCQVAGGTVSCWGTDFTDTQHITPMTIATGSYTQVAVGETAAVATDNTNVIGWGSSCQAIGSGSPSTILTPGANVVPGLPASTYIDVAIARGGSDACALVGANALWCWGGNHDKELSEGNVGCVPPFALSGQPINFNPGDTTHPQSYLSLYGDHGCSLSNDSSIMCWGDNSYREIGLRGDNDEPSVILEEFGEATMDNTFLYVAIGGTFSCGIDSAAELQCWGTGPNGELGNGARYMDKPVPVSQ